MSQTPFLLGHMRWLDDDGRPGASWVYWTGSRLTLETGAEVNIRFLSQQDAAGGFTWQTPAVRAWYFTQLVPYFAPHAVSSASSAYGSLTSTPPVSVGGLPPGVVKFSWGAFFFPFLWPLAYGLGGWGLLGVLINVFSPLSLPLAVWFGFAVNRAYWARFPRQMSVTEFNRRQEKWIVSGGVILGLYWLLLALGTFASLLQS
jgi:hypothetical protein